MYVSDYLRSFIYGGAACLVLQVAAVQNTSFASEYAYDSENGLYTFRTSVQPVFDAGVGYFETKEDACVRRGKELGLRSLSCTADYLNTINKIAVTGDLFCKCKDSTNEIAKKTEEDARKTAEAAKASADSVVDGAETPFPVAPTPELQFASAQNELHKALASHDAVRIAAAQKAVQDAHAGLDARKAVDSPKPKPADLNYAQAQAELSLAMNSGDPAKIAAAQKATRDAYLKTDAGKKDTALAEDSGAVLNKTDKDEWTTAGTDDLCPVTSNLDTAQCRATRGMIQGVQIADQVFQTGGAMAIQVTGNKEHMKASQEGTQAAALKAAANTAKAAAIKEFVIGGMNAMNAVVVGSQAAQHGSAASDLRAVASSSKGKKASAKPVNLNAARGTDGDYTVSAEGNKIATDIIGSFDLNNRYTVNGNSGEISATSCNDPKLAPAARDKCNKIKKDMQTLARRGAGEQSGVGQEATNAAVLTGIKAAAQLTTGSFAYMSALELEKAAKKMKGIENQNKNAFNFKQDEFEGGADGNAPGYTVGVGSEGTSSAANAVPDPQADQFEGFPDLGTPSDPLAGDGDSLAQNSPVPTPFTPGADQTGAAGAGGAGMGGGSGTPPAQEGANAEPSAQYAGMDNRGASYETGGAAGAYGGAGGGGAGAAGAQGPDLSGLLAQFLPKDEDTTPRGRNGILDFGGRKPATEPLSLLGSQVNIFNRIHEAYQERTKKGIVGVF